MENEGWQKLVLWGSFGFFLGALLLRQEAGINQDLGRHLRLGQAIVENNPPGTRYQALTTNFLTYTYPEYPFVNHHWGSEAIFYLIYKLGGFGGLILFKTLVLGGAFLITTLHALQRQSQSSNLKAQNQNSKLKTAMAIGFVFFSVQMMAERLTTRPEIFGYLLFSLLFWLLDRKNLSNWGNLPNWIVIPIVMIVWVNLHISFVFGLILVWIWAGNKILNTEFRILNEKSGKTNLFVIRYSVFRIQYLKILAMAVISTLVTILNPSGLRGALMPISIMKDYGYTIVENMTPFFLRAFKPQPEYWIYAGLVAITLILVIITGKLGKFTGLALFVFAIFPLIAVRHLAFFALAAPAVLLKGLSLPYGKDSPFGKLPALVAVGLLLAAMTNPVPLAYGKLPPVGLSADKRHEEAVKFVKNHDLPGKMWNNYDIGSYLEWALPEYKTFVDGRPEAFPAGFFQETYIPMQESRQKWDEVVKQYDIRWVFAALTDATPWFGKWRQMIGAHEGWRVVYIDRATAVLARQN